MFCIFFCNVIKDLLKFDDINNFPWQLCIVTKIIGVETRRIFLIDVSPMYTFDVQLDYFGVYMLE